MVDLARSNNLVNSAVIWLCYLKEHHKVHKLHVFLILAVVLQEIHQIFCKRLLFAISTQLLTTPMYMKEILSPGHLYAVLLSFSQQLLQYLHPHI